LIPSLCSCTRLFEFKAGHNQLSGLPATFKLCYRLRVLDLAGNKIKSTSAIQVIAGAPFDLCACASPGSSIDHCRSDIRALKASSPGPLQVLQKLKFLRHLTLKGNPICDVDGYRETLIDMLPNLESLDGKKVS
jgi:Leucine-rich repeat (LRR) protein